MIEISNLGIIGNCRSAVLINNDASLVWNCLPDFDSPSVFAKILDHDSGGEMSIIPQNLKSCHQSYVDKTNILQTHFETDNGRFNVIDFMPIYHEDNGEYYQPSEIYRLLKIISGKPVVKILYKPKLNYARTETKSVIYPDYIKSMTVKGDYHSIYLYSNLLYNNILDETAVCLESDLYFLISYHQKLIPIHLDRVYLELNRTKVYWMNWVNRTKNYPKYQKEIIRSALTLKLLTYQKTGAVVAAATTSLPENLNESRNWDYRFCWLRDSSMIIQTLLDINHKNTARQFLRFLLNCMMHKADTLQILYGIRGEKVLTEKSLSHLKGYKNCHPVRIGNAAYKQKQNDIYGVLMDLIYSSFLFFPTSLSESEVLWTTVRYIIKTVENNWHKADRGIWEIRRERRHYVFSKVLSWVAADRGVKIAQMLERKDFLEPWSKLRDLIKSDIESKGWNDKEQAYTQFYGSNDMDASLLLIEKVGFCNCDDPRYKSTVQAIYRELCLDGLMYRYKNKDDFGKPKSAFTICSFRMIDSLFKTGEKEKAVEMFNHILSFTNHLGLLSEDIDFKTHELLGNFPQGYSHLALINSAILLNEIEKKTSVMDFIKC